MTPEPLFCPYCNARIPLPAAEGAAPRIRCPRCGDTFPHRPIWEKLMANGMAQDFSWDLQGKEYVELYGRLVG